MDIENFPTPPPPETGDPDLSIVHYNPSEDVFSQIRQHGQNFLNRDTVDGVTYHLDDIDYVIDSDTLWHNNEPHVKIRKIAHTFSRNASAERIGAHKIEYKPEESEHIAVDGYQNGERISREYFEGARYESNPVRDAAGDIVDYARGEPLVTSEESPFGSFLNGIVRDCIERNIPLPEFRFAKVRPKPELGPDTREVTVDLSDKSKTVLESVLDTIDDENLEDGLFGLTFVRDGYIKRVVEEKDLWQKDIPGRKALREVVLQTLSPDEKRILNSVTLSMDELDKYFTTMNTPPNRPLKDVRFVVPVRHEAATDSGELYISEELAARDLAYYDMYDADDVSQQRLRNAVQELIESEPGQQKIQAYQSMVSEVGEWRVWEFAEQMLDTYHSVLEAYDLPQMRGDSSISWALNELAVRRYLADNPGYNLDVDYKGVLIGNPVEAGKAGLEVRRDIVDRRAGINYFINSKVMDRKERLMASVKLIDGEAAEVKEVDVTVTIKENILNLLQKSILGKVNKILLKPVQFKSEFKDKEGEPLTGADLSQLGALLGRGAGRRLTR